VQVTPDTGSKTAAYTSASVSTGDIDPGPGYCTASNTQVEVFMDDFQGQPAGTTRSS
jgi:hypothetical protein